MVKVANPSTDILTNGIKVKMNIDIMMVIDGSGGDASNRMMTACFSRPGSNAGVDLAFAVLNNCQSILVGSRALSKNIS